MKSVTIAFAIDMGMRAEFRLARPGEPVGFIGRDTLVAEVTGVPDVVKDADVLAIYRCNAPFFRGEPRITYGGLLSRAAAQQAPGTGRRQAA